MAHFPLLNTGAVSQYPLGVARSRPAQVMTFLDGSDQRYRTRGRSLRQWRIDLTLLNEDEMQMLESFFAAQFGEYSKFTFADPLSGVDVPNCRFGQDTFESAAEGVDNGSTGFWIVETNG